MFKGNVKLIKYKGNKLRRLLEEKSVDLLYEIGRSSRKHLREEVPVKTGNLRENQVIGELVRSRVMKSLVVGTDEDKVPYAKLVYYPGILRLYGGNDWVTRAVPKVVKDIPAIVVRVYKELDGIEL